MLFSRNKVKVIGKHSVSMIRKLQNDILKGRVVNLPNVETVLNVGANQEDPDKEGSSYLEYFKDKEYYTLNKYTVNDSSCHINLDIFDIENLNQKFDLILVMNVLEHVKDPFQAARNIKSLLNKSGYIFVCSPFLYPIHKDIHGHYSDYWRFTDDGLRILFEGMNEVWLEECKPIIKKVDDRPRYWDNNSAITPGYCVLYQNE